MGLCDFFLSYECLYVVYAEFFELVGDEGFHQLDNLPMNNSITHVMIDYEGNLWFTSTRQGVMKVVPNQFSNIYERCGLPEAVVNATCLLGDQLFVATDSGLTVIENGIKLDSLPLTGAATASGAALVRGRTSTFVRFSMTVSPESVATNSWSPNRQVALTTASGRPQRS